ncbi:unnamed protein product, partial [Discosporangium mesarthrocarpum]
GRAGGSPRADVFLRLSRISCYVCSAHVLPSQARRFTPGDLESENSVLKPCDLDAHLTRPGGRGTGDPGAPFDAGQGGAARPGDWQARLYLDELQVCFGTLHLQALGELASLFATATTNAATVAAMLSSRPPLGSSPIGRGAWRQAGVNDMLTLQRVGVLEWGRKGARLARRGPGEMVVMAPAENGDVEGGVW